MHVFGKGELDRLETVVGLGDDVEVGVWVEDRLQAGTDDRMIVSQ